MSYGGIAAGVALHVAIILRPVMGLAVEDTGAPPRHAAWFLLVLWLHMTCHQSVWKLTSTNRGAASQAGVVPVLLLDGSHVCRKSMLRANWRGGDGKRDKRRMTVRTQAIYHR